MALRIIDNKRIDLTAAEWDLYLEICKSYDNAHRQGKDLFGGLFETDKDGIIIFLKPPTRKYSSMEVYMYLVGVMVHQHLGTACDQVDALTQRMLEKEIAHDERMAAKEAALEERLAKKEALLDIKIQAVNDLLKKGSKIIKMLDENSRDGRPYNHLAGRK